MDFRCHWESLKDDLEDFIDNEYTKIPLKIFKSNLEWLLDENSNLYETSAVEDTPVVF